MKCSGEFSIWKKSIVLEADGVKYDISDKIPEWIWRYETKGNDFNLNNPVINWKIRVELAKAATEIMKEILGTDSVEVHC